MLLQKTRVLQVSSLRANHNTHNMQSALIHCRRAVAHNTSLTSLIALYSISALTCSNEHAKINTLTAIACGKVDWRSRRLGFLDGDFVAARRSSDSSATPGSATAKYPTPKG
jgi:hypothetical protein